jgi:hypothetical protein
MATPAEVAATNKKNAEDMAVLKAEFGWAAQIVTSNNELKRLFQMAVHQRWSAERFGAAIKTTSWYKHTSETARKADILKVQDPATYRNQIAQRAAQIKSLTGSIGAFLTPAQLNYMAAVAFRQGWTEQDVSKAAQGFIKYTTTNQPGSLVGKAGAAEDRLRGLAAANGVTVSNDWVLNQARAAAISKEGDTASLDKAMDWIQQQAIQAYPALAEQLNKRGADGAYTTVDQLAANYKAQMAKTLELNDKQITLQDPTLRKALQGTPDAQGKLASVPLWKFEQDLRQDNRWQYTDGAKKEVMGFADKVLKDFGYVGGGNG